MNPTGKNSYGDMDRKIDKVMRNMRSRGASELAIQVMLNASDRWSESHHGNALSKRRMNTSISNVNLRDYHQLNGGNEL